MTHALGPIPGLQTPSDASAARTNVNAKAADAAKKFESVLLQQLVAELRKTAMSSFGGDMPGGGVYGSMMDEALAEALSQGGGIGIASMLEGNFGGARTAAAPMGTVHRGAEAPLNPSLAVRTYAAVRGGAPLGGLGAKLSQAAAALAGAEPGRWARAGRLSPGDLASDLAMSVAGGVARFNVLDAQGFEGHYKCNLFALEAARRAGFQVPVVGRERGFGYPTPNMITADAADGQLKKDWAHLATGASAESIDSALRSGQRAFLLTGSATGERRGHMATVERVHEIEYGPKGEVRRIVFDGWEARGKKGAEFLEKRTWNIEGNPGGHLARNGFERIEILELKRAEGRGAEEQLLSRTAGASKRDDFF